MTDYYVPDPDGQDHINGLQTLAERYGVSIDAVRHLVRALEAGHGTMAQFDHPDLGGFGQWSSGGMTMVGDMFNTGLKARVGGLCTELAHALPALGWVDHASGAATWWPAEFGSPTTSGGQNGMRYAFFPERRRLAVEANGSLSVYDTGEHDISGVSQQQGTSQSLRFSGRDGPIDLESLRRLDAAVGGAAPEAAAPGGSDRVHAADAAASSEADILGTIERMSDLHRRGVLTDAEFAAKKADLLGRL